MRQAITLPGQPAKLYSDVVKAKGTLVFLAGQVGWRSDGSWGESFEIQTELALDNMKAALAVAGASIEQVAKVTVYLADARYGDVFNDIYARYFRSDRPVRTRIQTGLLARECLVEIDVIAVVASSNA